MAQLTFLLLGSPHLLLDDREISLDTRKAVALLAYLAVTGETHTREALATLLYPDYDNARARAALRRTLSALNTTIGSEWLQADRRMIGLAGDHQITCDVEEFDRLLGQHLRHDHPENVPCSQCQTWLEVAVDRYRDDFMTGFSLRDSANFDDWQFFETEHLRTQMSLALEHLIAQLVLRGDYGAAIPHARRWIALDSLHEPAHVRLMELYAWHGQSAAAVRQFQECERILDQELGVPPLETTRELYRAIIERRLEMPPLRLSVETTTPSPLPLEDSAPPTMLGSHSYPLVGRSPQLEILRRTYRQRAREGVMLVVTGEAGIGKTRLVDEFLKELRSIGVAVLTAQCYEGENILAYAPIVSALRTTSPATLSDLAGTMSPLALAEAARLLPDLGPLLAPERAIPPYEGPGAQVRFFQGVTELLHLMVAGSHPGVLFLDDLQWADDATLELITYMMRRLHGQPWCLVLTWRDGEGGLDYRLSRLETEARRKGFLASIRLNRLQPDDVSLLVATALGRRGPRGLDEQLYQETEGLPFFLIEYLNMLLQEDDLQATKLTAPASVDDLLHSHLSQAGETEQQILSAAAVLGRSFQFETLRLVSGRTEMETIQAVEALIGISLLFELVEGEGPVYDFSHQRLRTLVYEETSLARRRLLHRRAASALLQRSRRRPEKGLTAQVAAHHELAGDRNQALELYIDAAEEARKLYANKEALNHYQAALRLGYAPAGHLHEIMGDLHTLTGDYRQALDAYEAAATQVPTGELFRLEQKLGGLYQRLGDWHLADRHYLEAQRLLSEENDPVAHSRLQADRSLTAYARGELAQALTLAQKALTLAEERGDAQALAQAHNILGIVYTGQNQLDLAQQHLQKSLNLVQDMEDPTMHIAVLNNLARVHGARSDHDKAIDLISQALELCARLDDRHRLAALNNHMADLLHSQGREEEAMTYLKVAVRLFADIEEEGGPKHPQIWMLSTW